METREDSPREVVDYSGYRILIYPSLDSTSAQAGRMLDDGTAKDRDIILATHQRKGRGQGDHIWHSARGENLTFSIIRRGLNLKAEDQKEFSDSIAGSVIRYLEEKGIKAWKKEPNDIYVGSRKICGLLISHRVQAGTIQDSIIGIGINLNETDFPEDLPNPTSIALETKKSLNPEEELRLLLDNLTI